MERVEGEPLSSHLADFETTTSSYMRTGQALALLNFAALFHEYIYLPDTALGDHQLIIKSFQTQAHTGLFQHIRELIQEGILRVLVRDKVVVNGEVRVPSKPTLSDIYEGWRYRDKTKWEGETGYTVEIDDEVRRAYCREMDYLIQQEGVIKWYDSDSVKTNFRRLVREQLNLNSSRLAACIRHLPQELQNSYIKAVDDPWFTNAELWRILRKNDRAAASIILHGHINQQCFANEARAGQSAQDIGATSLASFNLELQSKRPFAAEVEATIEPPKNLEELMERAPILLPSPGVEMFERLSVQTIVKLRRRGSELFRIARQSTERNDSEQLRLDYLNALKNYWEFILEEFASISPDRMKRPRRLALFLEEQLPGLDTLYNKFGRNLLTLLLRVKLGVLSSAATDAIHHIGILALQERTPLNEDLRNLVPPQRWYRKGILGLSRFD